MLRFRSLPVLAVRRMRGNWRLLISVIIGTLVAGAVLASTAVYSDAIRDLGLDFALDTREPEQLDVRVSQSTIPVGRVPYEGSLERIDGAVAGALGSASGALVRSGTSATFFPTAPGAPAPTADDRPRGVLRFRSELEQHVVLFDGTLPSGVPSAAGQALPVAVGLETATRNGIAVGERFDLHPFWDPDAPPVPVEVTGIIEALDIEERYWGGDAQALDRSTRSWETIAFHVPESTFFGAMTDLLPGVQADYVNVYNVEFDALNARNSPQVSRSLDALQRTLAVTEDRLRIDTELVVVLETYDEKLFFTRIPLLVVLLQIAGIVAYYLMMVSNMLADRQSGEIALLRSRGATTLQLMALFSIEGVILAALAALAGPPIAGLAIAVLGLTPAFEALSGGELLQVNVASSAYLMAGVGALIAYVAMMVPAWRVTHTTMVQFKRSAARPRPTPLFLRYYLDVAFVVVAALVFWQLSQQEQLFTETIFGETQADPFLLLTPTVFLVTVGVVFLRLFPLALRSTAWAVGKTRSTAMLVGMRSLVRNPTHYTRLILLLMFATGVGMFGASFNATLDRSYVDRAAYAVGADLRASNFRALSSAGEIAFRTTVSDVPADVVSVAARVGGELTARGERVDIDLLGVDPATFAEVAFFRGDFASAELAEITAALGENGATLSTLPVAGVPRQIGAWIHAPDIRGRVVLGLQLRDSTGRFANVGLARIRPTDPVAEEWRFLVADLRPDLTRPTANVHFEPLVPPLEFVSFFINPIGSIASGEGTVLLGAVLSSEQPPPVIAEGEDDADPRQSIEGFANGQLVHAFDSVSGLEVISGYRPTRLLDRPVASAQAPPGFDGSIEYRWADSFRGPPVRGLRLATDSDPVLLYLLRQTAEALDVESGDNIQLLAGSRFMEAEVAGVIDLFPTIQVGGRSGFALVNVDRLLTEIHSGPTQSRLRLNEVWYATSDPTALRAALDDARFSVQTVVDIDSERIAQEQDPLVAAGWKGILAIAFGAVLLLSAIGFLVYSYLTAQQRALEFAILRTLGFSRLQIFSVVAFEHLFVIVAGVGLGTAVGLQVGRLMMDFLGVDERGREVLPPFVLGVSWPSVFLAWGILGSVFVVTIGAVVLLYFRLQVHRALRIGDA